MSQKFSEFGGVLNHREIRNYPKGEGDHRIVIPDFCCANCMTKRKPLERSSTLQNPQLLSMVNSLSNLKIPCLLIGHLKFVVFFYLDAQRTLL